MVLAALVAAAVVGLAASHRDGVSLAQSCGLQSTNLFTELAACGWIGTQTLLLTLPGLMLGSLFAERMPRASRIMSLCLIHLVLVVMVFDAIAFQWIAERLLSPATMRVASLLPGPLAGHIGWRMAGSVGLSVIGLVIFAVIAQYSSAGLARLWLRLAPRLNPVAATLMILAVGSTISFPILLRPRVTLGSMALNSSFHPWCVFRPVDHRGVGISMTRA